MPMFQHRMWARVPGSPALDGDTFLTTKAPPLGRNRLWDLWGNQPALGFVYSWPLNFLNSNSVLRTTDLCTTSLMQPLQFGELETWGWSNLGLHSHGNHVYT